ncbi:DUF2484 family protein [Pseudoroseicyclus tamaricis]|uniref:DUF2484 family protein n=1 Tax=Pseudoroseicyclus tamaricis TaxID=2705421 RepID=A0A6B2K420_9RHOB|nr:DUF2484 family protein [Pseudoroseicyclus tamaricis]NDV01396.1 DUF2484 family protein [Pseudoroseicyclus tamaricis]
MTVSLIAGIIWVLAGSVTAKLPMRHQVAPGLALIATAPVLLGWIAWDHGWIWLVLGLAAFVSMMRHPLRYLLARMRGEAPGMPAEMRR